MIKKLKEKNQETENGEKILIMMIMVMTLTPIMTMLMITEKNSLQLLYSLFTSGAPKKYAYAAIWLVRAII